MIEKILGLLGIKLDVWRLEGYDTFSGETYHLPGWSLREVAAQSKARRRLKQLEKTQPSAYSGGQKPEGIQDQVYIIRPDGSQYRYTLGADET